MTVEIYGDFVVVDDDQDRWVGRLEDYQSGLDLIAKNALTGRYERECLHEAYSDLCNECPALYSRIGLGEFNKDVAGLVKALDESVTREGVEEILAYLGIDLEEAEIDLDELCTVEAE